MNSTISKIKGVFNLLKNIDIDQLSQISQKVDLPKLMHQFSKLDKNQLNSLTKMLDSSGKKKRIAPHQRRLLRTAFETDGRATSNPTESP